MFEVLAFVYENYGRGAPCPEPLQLGRKLSAHGFEDEEIDEALQWLDGLSLATQGLRPGPDASDPAATAATVTPRSEGTAPTIAPSPGALRVYGAAEQAHLGAACLGFIRFLESAQALPAGLREIVIDRAMAAPGDPVALDELKIIVLMVYWSSGSEPGVLVLGELCDDLSQRVAH